MSGIVIFPLDGTGRTITVGGATGVVTLAVTAEEQAADCMFLQVFTPNVKVAVTHGGPLVANPVITAAGTPGPAGTPRLGGSAIWGYWVRGQIFRFLSDAADAFDIEIFFADLAYIGGNRIGRIRGNTAT